MKSQQIADQIMRGILKPVTCDQDDVEIAVKFVQLIAHTLCLEWKDPCKLEQTCTALVKGFTTGRLALLAKPKSVAIIQARTGETRVLIPLDQLTRLSESH